MNHPSDEFVPGGVATAGAADEEDEKVRGERGRSVALSMRPLQARIRSWLASALLGSLAVGLLVVYYLHTYQSSGPGPRKAAHAAPATLETESKSLPLGPLPAPAPSGAAGASPSGASAAVVGDPPPLPAAFLSERPWSSATGGSAVGPAGEGSGDSSPEPRPKSGWQRRLDSPVLYRNAAAPGLAPSMIDGGAAVDPSSRAEAGSHSSPLATALQPTVTAVARARVLPTRRWLLPKGAFVDCTLETAIDSQLAGLTTCVTAVDVLSADGTIVLLERGTKLVGDARAEVRPGQNRVFVLWNEARTPTGVVADLASPGTDALGRSGVDGAVDTHFADRFGAAILVSIISGAVQAAANRGPSGGVAVYNPQASTEILTEILRNTISIPPTIKVPQGTRLQVLVARDVDFRDVYALKPRS
jgi:type IV secretion system protein VirB10